MLKLFLYPSLSMCWRSRRTHRAWKVDMVTRLASSLSTILARRSRISPAALLVKVSARMHPGSNPWAMRNATREVMTRVLPVPAPARMRSGPAMERTARSWASFRSKSRMRQFREDFRVKGVLLRLDARVEGLGGVARKDGDFPLRDDFPAVHARIDIMHRAAGDAFAARERLFPRLHPRKLREQRGMDVDDPPRKGREHRLFQHPHETGKDHQVDFRLLQDFHDGVLGLRLELRAEPAGRDKDRLYPAFPRKVEDGRGLHVGEDDGGLGAQPPLLDLPLDRREVGAFPRAEHAEANRGSLQDGRRRAARNQRENPDLAPAFAQSRRFLRVQAFDRVIPALGVDVGPHRARQGGYPLPGKD